MTSGYNVTNGYSGERSVQLLLLTCEWNDCLLAVLRRARRRRKVLRAAPQLQSSKAEGKTNIPRGKHEDPYLATK